MSDKVTKSGTVEQKFVLNFDTAPTIKQMLDACKAIDSADRVAVLKTCKNGADQVVNGATRFIFTVAVTTDTDIPITP